MIKKEKNVYLRIVNKKIPTNIVTDGNVLNVIINIIIYIKEIVRIVKTMKNVIEIIILINEIMNGNVSVDFLTLLTKKSAENVVQIYPKMLNTNLKIKKMTNKKK